jgi:hypothetical protein
MLPYERQRAWLMWILVPALHDSRPPVETFAIGCAQHRDAPIFVWMESGTHVAYAKIMVAKTKDGKTEYLWH